MGQGDPLPLGPGVGPLLSRPCLADLAELGRLNWKQIAAPWSASPPWPATLARCADGASCGAAWPRHAALYMATLVATRHTPVIRACSLRLLQAGNPKKVALVACMRKLLTIVNAMARDNAPWDPDRHVRTA